MTDNIKNLSDAEKKLSIEERAKRAAFRIAKKHTQNTTEEPKQAAAGKTNKKGEIGYDNKSE